MAAWDGECLAPKNVTRCGLPLHHSVPVPVLHLAVTDKSRSDRAAAMRKSRPDVPRASSPAASEGTVSADSAVPRA